ncbi:MAG: hypoxanthine phosphoribosyltransferase [Synergistaceae bacterium]
MNYKIGRNLISKDEIHKKVAELAAEIRRDFAGQTLICVCVLKGASIFLADLIRAIGPEVDIQMDFLAISSYGASTKSSGVVKIQKDLGCDIQGKNVLIVEDILDTGLSLAYIKALLSERNPQTLSVCVLLDKEDRRIRDTEVQYSGFKIPDEFVIGYGLDFAGRFRHLEDICIAEPFED